MKRGYMLQLIKNLKKIMDRDNGIKTLGYNKTMIIGVTIIMVLVIKIMALVLVIKGMI